MIAAIIVTYNPEQAVLKKLLERCLSQVEAVIVVDNGSSVPVKQWLDDATSNEIHWLPLGENKGVAAAHNAGIREARRLNADYVLLFDHDSLPAPDMVKQLTTAMEQKKSEGYRIAAVGPCYKDSRRITQPPFLRIQGLRLVRHSSKSGKPVVPVDFLISSGSLIPMSTLDAIGVMQEALFIDYIDIEWGLRAKTKGFASFGVFTANMEHSLGESPVKVFGRTLPMHSPLRHYYIFRNAIWLYRQKNLPLSWKLVDGRRLIYRFAGFAIFGTPRRSHIRNMLHGMADGLRGKMGKL